MIWKRRTFPTWAVREAFHCHSWPRNVKSYRCSRSQATRLWHAGRFYLWHDRFSPQTIPSLNDNPCVLCWHAVSKDKATFDGILTQEPIRLSSGKFKNNWSWKQRVSSLEGREKGWKAFLKNICKQRQIKGSTRPLLWPSQEEAINRCIWHGWKQRLWAWYSSNRTPASEITCRLGYTVYLKNHNIFKF